MTKAALQRQAPGQFSLVGELNFESVPYLLDACEALFQAGDEVRLDLSQLERCDSAGLALLVNWLRQAKNRQCRLIFQQIPEQLLGLARVSGADQLLLSA